MKPIKFLFLISLTLLLGSLVVTAWGAIPAAPGADNGIGHSQAQPSPEVLALYPDVKRGP